MSIVIGLYFEMPLFKCAGKSANCLMRDSVPDTTDVNGIRSGLCAHIPVSVDDEWEYK